MKSKIILLIFLGLLAFVSTAYAVPMVINVQGRVTNDRGLPISGSVDLRFGVHDTDGTADRRDAIWKTETTVTLGSDGVFNVLLGNDPVHDSGPLLDFLNDQYYLDVRVNGQTLLPRQQLVSVPFAITAKNVRGGTVSAEGSGDIPAITGSGEIVGVYGTGRFSGIIGMSPIGVGCYGVGQSGGVFMGNQIGAMVMGMTTEANGIGLQASSRGVGVLGLGVVVGGSFESSSGIGVYSSGTVGVYGKGLTAGEFEALTGVSTATIGIKASGQTAVVASGEIFGVRAHGPYAGGIFDATSVISPFGGATVFLGPGLRAHGNIGVEATGEVVGVYGKGATGGSFESTSPDGVGLYASSIAAGNANSPFQVKTFNINNLGSHASRTVVLPVNSIVLGVSGMVSTVSDWFPVDATYFSYSFPRHTLTIMNSSSGAVNFVGVIVYTQVSNLQTLP